MARRSGTPSVDGVGRGTVRRPGDDGHDGWSIATVATPEVPRTDGSSSGRATRSQRTVFTLYGDYLRSRTGEVWVGSLIQLLEPLGLSEQATRSTLSRMLRHGWFETQREGRLSFYVLSPRSERLLDEGAERLFAPAEGRPWDGRWRLLTYSVPEEHRTLRDRLRQRLVWFGFGNLNPGTWLSPYEPPPDLMAWLERTGAARYVDLFHADYPSAEVAGLVARAWDLDGLHQAYESFLAEHRAETLAAAAPDPVEAFARRFHLTEEFLSFPYVDPGLPPELLPHGWPGPEVRRVFRATHDLLAAPAAAFVDGVLAQAPERESKRQP